VRLATGARPSHSAQMDSGRLDSILLFTLPVVVIVIALLWSITRAIDRVARKLERLASVLEKKSGPPKE
jgi:hypothetical protein